MKIVKWSVIALVTLAALVYLIGWSLPVAHVASISAAISRPPQDVYDIVADVRSYPQWWPEISKVDMLPTEAGRIRFREHMTGGPVVMEVIEAVPPARFATRIADPDQPFGGTWTFEFVPENSGTRLTITERGEVYDPLFRFLSRFVFGHTGTMNSFVAALSQKL